jgi:hypothetical protein
VCHRSLKLVIRIYSVDGISYKDLATVCFTTFSLSVITSFTTFFLFTFYSYLLCHSLCPLCLLLCFVNVINLLILMSCSPPKAAPSLILRALDFNRIEKSHCVILAVLLILLLLFLLAKQQLLLLLMVVSLFV